MTTRRETIARIIDPKAWRIRDEQYAAIDRLKLFPLDEAETKKAVDADIRDSLAKADAILAARPTLSETQPVAAWADSKNHERPMTPIDKEVLL